MLGGATLKHDFSPKTRIELDLVGQYYASIINAKQPGVFSISAHLKERINPPVLQEAVNDIVSRLPFINGRLRRGFFCYEHEILATPPKIIQLRNTHTFRDYYNYGRGHVLRVLYGESFFTVEAIHSICDGRGLSKIISALIVRYYELLGVEIEKNGIIDCSGEMHPEEAENAFLRYANSPIESCSRVKKGSTRMKAYRAVYPKAITQHVITQKFDVSELKVKSKAHNLSITGFILACIFKGLAEERAINGNTRPITAMLPIDCRSFLPSKTLRSFVSSRKIVMPETVDDAEMASQIKTQLDEINKESVLYEISKLQSMYNKTRYIPRIAKNLFMKAREHFEALGTTTGFSNIGLIKLPLKIENRVDMLEFAVSLDQETPYFFSCITVGNTLALTATIRDEGEDLVKNVMRRIEC